MAFETYNRSIPDIVSDVIGQAAALVRKEGQLARAEVSEKMGEAATAIILIIAGAVLLIPALVILLGAAVAALTEAGLSPTISALIVGGVALLLGLVLAFVGKSRLDAEHLKPKRTIRQVQGAANLAKQQMRNGSDQQRAA